MPEFKVAKPTLPVGLSDTLAASAKPGHVDGFGIGVLLQRLLVLADQLQIRAEDPCTRMYTSFDYASVCCYGCATGLADDLPSTARNGTASQLSL